LSWNLFILSHTAHCHSKAPGFRIGFFAAISDFGKRSPAASRPAASIELRIIDNNKSRSLQKHLPLPTNNLITLYVYFAACHRVSYARQLHLHFEFRRPERGMGPRLNNNFQSTIYIRITPLSISLYLSPNGAV
jgi:hypothetical protein